MDKKQVSCWMKKITTGFLTVGMLSCALMCVPQEVHATTDDQLLYSTTYEIATYWEDGKKAPVKEGYVFGGWYKGSEEGVQGAQKLALDTDKAQTDWFAPLTAGEIDANSDGKVDSGVTAYAKFVPSYVLSVKAQNMEGTEDTTASTYVRVISSLDSTNYQNVGFEIFLSNTIQLYLDNDTEKKLPLETTNVYSGLMVGTETVKTADEIFGDASQYLSVWQLQNIKLAKYQEIIYVRPYWHTVDGTKVNGLAKYIHVEDDYNNYISIPVNVFSENDVAAGAVDMTYDYAGLENMIFEKGRILPEMTCNHDADAKTIYMVGNAMTDGEYHTGETLYANIRFKKPSLVEDTTLNFTMSVGEFGDWDKTLVENVVAWDVACYVKSIVDPTDPVAMDLY